MRVVLFPLLFAALWLAGMQQLGFTQALQADSVFLKVRIFCGKPIQHLQITALGAPSHIFSSKERLEGLAQGEHVSLALHGKKVQLTRYSVVQGNYDTLRFNNTHTTGLLGLRNGKETRKYNDEVIVYVSSGKLFIINNVSLEHYTAGVVLSEGGNAGNHEFFKLQCLISRTYALRNIRKHEQEGYQLCDMVHCQLYKGHTSKKDILDAIDSTRGLVILSADTQLISAAFHSNSGGQTINSEDVWSLPSSYLKARIDSHSTSMPMATWEKKINKDKWLRHLKTKYSFPVENKVMLDSALHFTQAQRKVFYIRKIPLKELRADFALRSTWFDIIDQGDVLLFRGKGYGHGVGLSQEGAIRMARDGFPYEDILHYYYRNIRIAPLDTSLIPKKKPLFTKP